MKDLARVLVVWIFLWIWCYVGVGLLAPSLRSVPGPLGVSWTGWLGPWVYYFGSAAISVWAAQVIARKMER
ncbi:hypothetical protein [Desulfovirgula thermocuniculi]|uniref:hypothetical protein n=1 Tax=Desulfovirgula thermocuniculi TaxID=348842 RepID=UPI00040F20C5|nr:hypothetical protein [Desulfovirgula thermocuniculi]